MVQVSFDLHQRQLEAIDERVDANDYASRAQFLRAVVARGVGIDGDGNRIWLQDRPIQRGEV